jgi:hypothetical protein
MEVRDEIQVCRCPRLLATVKYALEVFEVLPEFESSSTH